jgi:hypothetical protein
MNKLTALIQSGMALLCLLLTLPFAQLTAQTELCPPYPRAMDQAFFCLEVDNGSIRLKLDQKASPCSWQVFALPKIRPFPRKSRTCTHRSTRASAALGYFFDLCVTRAPSSSGINRYFNICYRQSPSPGQPIPAKMNYWGEKSAESHKLGEPLRQLTQRLS